MSVTVTAFYKFVTVDAPDELRASLHGLCGSGGIKGTILIAREGINATVAGPDAAVRNLLATLRSDARFADLVSKESFAPAMPFGRLKVKVKPEIVTLRRPEADPSQRVGTYVPPDRWNALLREDDVIVIDTRNDYEVAIGTFKGAIDPGTRAFSEFPEFVSANLDPGKHPRVAMFCTGGIRCEKASAYLLSRGFPEVYHLEGGILKYLETVPQEESLWQGECFVFDERVALEHGVVPGSHVMCAACGMPKTEHAGECPRCGAADKAEPDQR